MPICNTLPGGSGDHLQVRAVRWCLSVSASRGSEKIILGLVISPPKVVTACWRLVSAGTALEVSEAAGSAAAATGCRAGEAEEAEGDRREPGSQAQEGEGAPGPRGAEEAQQREAR